MATPPVEKLCMESSGLRLICPKTRKLQMVEGEVSDLHTLLSARLYYIESPVDRVTSGERVMTNIVGTLGLDERVCVCFHVNVHQIPKAKATGLIEGHSGIVTDRKRQKRQLVHVCVRRSPAVV